MVTASSNLMMSSQVRSNNWIGLVSALSASVIIGILGKLAIPLPFTPVPLVLQCQMVLLAGILLGKKGGFIAAMSLLIQGLIGLPVFSSGASGLLYMLGPTGGYLLGYPIAAWITGYYYQQTKQSSSLSVCKAMVIGNGVIYLLGMSWLSLYVGISSAFMLGVAPFIIGDLCKVILMSKIVSFRRNS